MYVREIASTQNNANEGGVVCNAYNALKAAQGTDGFEHIAILHKAFLPESRDLCEAELYETARRINEAQAMSEQKWRSICDLASGSECDWTFAQVLACALDHDQLHEEGFYTLTHIGAHSWGQVLREVLCMGIAPVVGRDPLKRLCSEGPASKIRRLLLRDATYWPGKRQSGEGHAIRISPNRSNVIAALMKWGVVSSPSANAGELLVTVPAGIVGFGLCDEPLTDLIQSSLIVRWDQLYGGFEGFGNRATSSSPESAFGSSSTLDKACMREALELIAAEVAL